MGKGRLIFVMALVVTEVPSAVALQSERSSRGGNVFVERLNAPLIPPPERKKGRKVDMIVGRRPTLFEIKKRRCYKTRGEKGGVASFGIFDTNK